MIYVIILLALAIVAFFGVRHIFKVPKCGNMVLITGGVKTGKSLLSVRMVYKLWKKQVFKAKAYNFLAPILGVFLKRFRGKKREIPLIYSNVPLALPYVPITQGILERKERIVYGSVAYFCEFSLIADSMSYKDKLLNERMLLLFKLWAHLSMGGYAIADTQSILDCHMSLKRVLSTYLYIHHMIKLPFVNLQFVRELKFSEDNSVVNTFDSDVEDSLKIVVVPKHKTYKMYDRYCFSSLSEDLPVQQTVVDGTELDDLKARKIVSVKEYYTIPDKYLEKSEVIENDESE